MSGEPSRFQPVECPVDFVQVNENVTRLNAGQALLLVVLWLFTASPVIPAFLAIDFLLRAANYGRFSPLNLFSGFLVRIFSISAKPVDRAPKRFAAGVGSIFSLAILILSLIPYTLAAGVLAGVLILFASLEAFVAFCAGCYVYFFLKKFRPFQDSVKTT
jgi:Domain of unknown function (DUF4395)